MNVFEELLQRLSSKTRIRQLFKDVQTSDLERILSRAKDVLEEKQSVRDSEEQQRMAKQENIEAIKQLMAARGVSVNDFGLGNETASKRRNNTPKYTFQYQTNAGDNVVWEGVTTGRLPRDFQAYLDRTGKKRMDCVIEDQQED